MLTNPTDAAWRWAAFARSQEKYREQGSNDVPAQQCPSPRAYQAEYEADAVRQGSVRLGDRPRSGEGLIVLLVCAVIALIATAANN